MARNPHTITAISSSMAVYADKREYQRDHFKWDSIIKFIYLAFTFASTLSDFDIFAAITENVNVYDFLVCEIAVGMPYMFLDFFIKQYTRKLDFTSQLNPLLKAITIGILLQTALWAMLHACDLADSIRYLFILITTLKTEANWSRCETGTVAYPHTNCISVRNVLMRCSAGNFTNFTQTSAHYYYSRSYSQLDKNVLTVRFFLSALVWIFNFFCTTITTETLIKIFKFSFLWKFFSTAVILILVVSTKNRDAVKAFTQLLNAAGPTTYSLLDYDKLVNAPFDKDHLNMKLYTNLCNDKKNAMDHTACVYGIGFIGVYDFGTMSAYTMVDNAVIIFTVIFSISAFARSLIIKILFLVLKKCVHVEMYITPHYLMYAILPLSAEFFYGHKLYIIYFYVNVMLATNAYLAMLTLSMSKLLHSEFRSVKNMYIVGILCFLGFSLSVPMTIQSTLGPSRHQGLIYGLEVTVLYLGGFKAAVVMWVYGLQTFATDVRFWLGFKPTKFWTICWTFLPVVLLTFFAYRVYKLAFMTDFSMVLTAALWIGFSIFIVALAHMKTLASFLLKNNFAKAFMSSSKYGPLEADDLMKRRLYNETVQMRRCLHNCNVIDDSFNCNHLPLYTSRTRLSSDSDTDSAESLGKTTKVRVYRLTVKPLSINDKM